MALLSACSICAPITGHRSFSLFFNDCLAFFSIDVPILTQSAPKPVGIEVVTTLCHYKQCYISLFVHMCEDEFLKELLYVYASL